MLGIEKAFDIGGVMKRVLNRIWGGESWREDSVNDWRRVPEGMNATSGGVMGRLPISLGYPTNNQKKNSSLTP
ncbi:MAG: hypothetical protein ABEK59_06985 [Halobacteria archaeon]